MTEMALSFRDMPIHIPAGCDGLARAGTEPGNKPSIVWFRSVSSRIGATAGAGREIVTDPFAIHNVVDSGGVVVVTELEHPLRPNKHSTRLSSVEGIQKSF